MTTPTRTTPTFVLPANMLGPQHAAQCRLTMASQMSNSAGIRLDCSRVKAICEAAIENLWRLQQQANSEGKIFRLTRISTSLHAQLHRFRNRFPIEYDSSELLMPEASEANHAPQGNSFNQRKLRFGRIIVAAAIGFSVVYFLFLAYSMYKDGERLFRDDSNRSFEDEPDIIKPEITLVGTLQVLPDQPLPKFLWVLLLDSEKGVRNLPKSAVSDSGEFSIELPVSPNDDRSKSLINCCLLYEVNGELLRTETREFRAGHGAVVKAKFDLSP